MMTIESIRTQSPGLSESLTDKELQLFIDRHPRDIFYDPAKSWYELDYNERMRRKLVEFLNEKYLKNAILGNKLGEELTS